MTLEKRWLRPVIDPTVAVQPPEVLPKEQPIPELVPAWQQQLRSLVVMTMSVESANPQLQSTLLFVVSHAPSVRRELRRNHALGEIIEQVQQTVIAVWAACRNKYHELVIDGQYGAAGIFGQRMETIQRCGRLLGILDHMPGQELFGPNGTRELAGRLPAMYESLVRERHISSADYEQKVRPQVPGLQQWLIAQARPARLGHAVPDSPIGINQQPTNEQLN
jgi:hypothetical protein